MKKEGTIVVDTLFTFNGRRVLLEAIPIINDEDFEKEVESFREEFLGRTIYWRRGRRSPEIVDQRYFEVNEV